MPQRMLVLLLILCSRIKRGDVRGLPRNSMGVDYGRGGGVGESKAGRSLGLDKKRNRETHPSFTVWGAGQ